MTSPLDQVSYQIGALDAQVAILLARGEKRDAELKFQTEVLNEIKAALKPILEDSTYMKPHVEHYAGARKRRAWVNSVLIGVTSIFGSTVATWFMRKYGG